MKVISESPVRKIMTITVLYSVVKIIIQFVTCILNDWLPWSLKMGIPLEIKKGSKFIIGCEAFNWLLNTRQEQNIDESYCLCTWMNDCLLI